MVTKCDAQVGTHLPGLSAHDANFGIAVDCFRVSPHSVPHFERPVAAVRQTVPTEIRSADREPRMSSHPATITLSSSTGVFAESSDDLRSRPVNANASALQAGELDCLGFREVRGRPQPPLGAAVVGIHCH